MAVLPSPSVHGNVKYKFHEMKKVNDFFIVDPEKRFSICSSLRNYNKRNNLNIAVRTIKTEKGVLVVRIK